MLQVAVRSPQERLARRDHLARSMPSQLTAVLTVVYGASSALFQGLAFALWNYGSLMIPPRWFRLYMTRSIAYRGDDKPFVARSPRPVLVRSLRQFGTT